MPGVCKHLAVARPHGIVCYVVDTLTFCKKKNKFGGINRRLKDVSGYQVITLSHDPLGVIFHSMIV